MQCKHRSRVHESGHAPSLRVNRTVPERPQPSDSEAGIVFDGLDDIDWGAMRHAYGPATELPEVLRALASDDPTERESALGVMYSAVHHQGDVYECTVAAIPFLLEIVTRSGLPGRGGCPSSR